MNLFGKVKFGENLNEHANFRNFGQSLLLLLRMVTGEAWNSVMYDCMITPATSGCDDSSDCAIGECCGSQGAPAYFIAFVVLGTFVTLNLLIAVVVDNFSNQKREEEGGREEEGREERRGDVPYATCHPDRWGARRWRTRPDAVWRHFVVTGRFLAVLMPTGSAMQSTVLA